VYSLLIHNAAIALPDGHLLHGDLACENGQIARIAPTIDARAEKTIDAVGRMLMPGVIDPHVHFREPGLEHKENLASGSRAAAAGGVTSFLEMPNTTPPTITRKALEDKLARAARSSVVNYGFFLGATPDNLDEISAPSKACGIKVFMGCSTGGLLVDRDEDLDKIFSKAHGLIAVHAEDEARIHERRALFAGRTDPAVHSEIRDNLCALRATERALAFARQYRRRLHILHMSTHEEVELLRRDKPDWIRAEAIPNHLLLNSNDYARLGSRVQMNPPVRTPQDNLALWDGLLSGVIDFLGTDHAPHLPDEKGRPYPQSPSGMPGVETALPLMLTQMEHGRCNLRQLLNWMCSGPAEAYGIQAKGRLIEGWDADLVLVDLAESRPVEGGKLHSKSGWSPYEGWSLRGWPHYTVVGGHVVFEKGTIHGDIRGQALRFGAQ